MTSGPTPEPSQARTSFRCLSLEDSCTRWLRAFFGSRYTISTSRMPELTHSTLKEFGEQIGCVSRYGRQFRQNRNTQARRLSSSCPTLDATQTTIPAETAFNTIAPAMSSRELHG